MTGLVGDAVCRLHDPGAGHPERPARYDAVLNGLAARGLLERLVRVPARDATEAELALCHMPGYMAAAREDIRSGRGLLRTGDTHVNAHSWAAALRAAGGVLAAVDAVLDGTAKRVFCCVRPPGHHATADRGMGFCVFNNVALGARYAQRRHGVARVAIVDWDVHHGNGTQAIFYSDPTVLYCSLHQWPQYPGTGRAHERGAGPGRNRTLNVPFAAGSGPHEFREAFRTRVLPAAREFAPELVLISAGFDGHAADPLGGFYLEDRDFAEMTDAVLEVAEVCAAGRVISVLEGGYNLDALASACGAHVARLIEG
ncbi:MAG: histone deacetylase [Lentisphaerae bacterium]|nr:histone deacetylase [Lentisphaerota bacterium]